MRSTALLVSSALVQSALSQVCIYHIQKNLSNSYSFVCAIEPAMDELISAVFGDDSIFLSCSSGECLHYTMVPGFKVR